MFAKTKYKMAAFNYTLAELHYDVETAYKNDKLNLLLNQPPHASWLKKNPMTGTLYLPIDKVEFLLTRIFQEWKREIISYTLILNSVAVHVRLHVLNPTTGVWSFHDGVGAAPIPTDSGKAALDMAAVKTLGVQMALPAAVSFGLKDAADNLGKLFGRDLNRKDAIDFTGSYNERENVPVDTPPLSPDADKNKLIKKINTSHL